MIAFSENYDQYLQVRFLYIHSFIFLNFNYFRLMKKILSEALKKNFHNFELNNVDI